MSSTDNKQITLPIEWPYRMLGHLVILLFVFVICAVAVIIKTEMVQKKISDLTKQVYSYTNTLGFTIDDIIVEGREKTTLQEIRDILNFDRETNILNLNLEEIKQNLETLPWVKATIVKRGFFPNVLHIIVTERQVQSIWQISEKFYPIDTEGNVINADFKADRPFLLIVGPKAPENITKLLAIIQKNSEIYSRIKVAHYISERRWNLILDDVKNGITIKLPEEDVKEAWEKLVKLNSTEGLLKRKLTIVDLRLKNKVIVKLGKINVKKETKESKI